MLEPITMRPHHFLCMLGYKGAGYDTTHVKNWEVLSHNFSHNPETRVRITMKEDSFCQDCPKAEKAGNFCDKEFVRRLDTHVSNLLELRENMVYFYGEITQKLFKIFDPVLHAKVCSGCAWRKKGFCQDTFSKTNIKFIA